MIPSELRLNNLVEINGFEKDGDLYFRAPGMEVWQEVVLTPKLLSQILSFQKLKSDTDISMLVRGITLTEEWLLKFGYSQDRNGYSLEDKNSLSFSVTAEGEYKPCWNDRVLSAGLTTKYVHQLQNLYFALTGEELTTL
jgi:hypothetical protein